jgi:hypothetical protein
MCLGLLYGVVVFESYRGVRKLPVVFATLSLGIVTGFHIEPCQSWDHQGNH